uniref:Uncharacterized protein n=1 Tax=Anguilla anguilla TaxID=7936 RepID=A0A0E9QC58_ANGAN
MGFVSYHNVLVWNMSCNIRIIVKNKIIVACPK